MSKFADTVRQDTPRLAVMFGYDGTGEEQFQWGIVGQMPLIGLLGAIVRVQAELSFRSPEECPQPAIVIVWDSSSRKFEWFAHPSTPVDHMVGMLETIKETLLGTLKAKRAANQQVCILGTDGKPLRR